MPESGLRRLLKALEASAEDRLLSIEGKISTNEIVRRAEAAETRIAVEKRDASEREREQVSLVDCKAVCD